MPWRGPSYEGEFPSLGHDVVTLIESSLVMPDGTPISLTEEQVTFIVRFYGLDARGRFIFRRATMRRSKGWGKSPLGGGICLAELVGDVVPDGWDSDGEPVGRPRDVPWIQVAAVSEDQTDNLYVQLYDMLRDSPALDDYGIDLGLTRIFLKGRSGRIEPVTSSSGSREGQPVTFAALEETHLWTPSNGGKKLAATVRRNVAKTNGRTLELTNAFSPGDNSVAEDTHKAALNGAAGILYDALEAPPVEDLHDRKALKAALKIAYGDAHWIDLNRIADECTDPDTDPGDARRFYLNQIVKATGRAIDPRRWAELTRPDLVVPDGARIGIGFDGSISDDATVLVGCTAEGHVFLIDAWERPDRAEDWRVPRREVRAAVLAARDRWSVGRFLGDPPKWWTELDDWAGEFPEDVVALLDTNQPRRFAPACDRFSTAVREGSITHDGSELLTRHVLNMARKNVRLNEPDLEDGRVRFVFVKGGTGKIDAGIGATLALEAAMTMPAPVDYEPVFGFV